MRDTRRWDSRQQLSSRIKTNLNFPPRRHRKILFLSSSSSSSKKHEKLFTQQKRLARVSHSGWVSFSIYFWSGFPPENRLLIMWKFHRQLNYNRHWKGKKKKDYKRSECEPNDMEMRGRSELLFRWCLEYSKRPFQNTSVQFPIQSFAPELISNLYSKAKYLNEQVFSTPNEVFINFQLCGSYNFTAFETVFFYFCCIINIIIIWDGTEWKFIVKMCNKLLSCHSAILMWSVVLE